MTLRRALPLFLLLLAGCVGPRKPVIAPSSEPRSAAHLFVNRPLKVIPEPDEFIQGVMTTFTEELVLSGYDFTGTTLDPKNEAALLAHLAGVNDTVPGTVGIHLTFVEAPVVVGFGTSYTSVTCTVYDAVGNVVLSVSLDPPKRRSLRELFLPRRQPDVDGRRWGKTAWESTLALILPPRG